MKTYETLKNFVEAEIAEYSWIKKVKIVKELPYFSMLNTVIIGKYKKFYTVQDKILYIQAIVCFDNIAEYYEYFDEDDLLEYASIINNVFQDRINKICGNSTRLGRYSFFKIAKANILKEKYVVGYELFGIKDKLEPIEDYIALIKSSKEYIDLFETGSTLEYLDLSKFEDISKTDINKCISYNNGKEVGFAKDSDYYGVPKRLLKFIIPCSLNPNNRQRILDNKIESVWEECGFDIMTYRIKKEFQKEI